MIESTTMIAVGMSHQMVSATRLPAKFGLYVALVLPSRYFHAKTKSSVNTGIITINDSKRAIIMRWSSFWAIIPFGSNTGILVSRKYRVANDATPRITSVRNAILYFFGIFLLSAHERNRYLYYNT